MTRNGDDRGPEETLDERLSAWLDGELDAAAETELRAELEARPELAARLAQFQRVDDALRTLPEPAVQPELAARLRERIAREGRPRIPRRTALRAALARRRRWTMPVLAAAAALALLALPRLRETPSPEETPLAGMPTPPSAPEAAPPQPGLVPPLEPMPAPEELALAVEIESEMDLEVIEMLEWLETLGEIESS